MRIGAVRQVAKNVGPALQSAMRAIETANPDKLYGIFGDAQWTNKDRLSPCCAISSSISAGWSCPSPACQRTSWGRATKFQVDGRIKWDY
jgi:hypothetical protein